MTDKQNEFSENDKARLNELVKEVGYGQTNDLAKILDKMLPPHINYVLFGFGTLVMVKPEHLEEFISFDNWDLPEHRFKNKEAAEEIANGNQEYLDLFLKSPDYTDQEKSFFQTALRFLQIIGYAYPGGERSDRNVMSLPLSDIPNLDTTEFDRKTLYAVTWPMTPGIFNHLFEIPEVENFDDNMACGLGGDLFRYDYLQPRFHSIRVANNESD